MRKGNSITFYPSSWLYNAGVIGFLKVLKEIKESDSNKSLNIYLEEHIEIKFDELNKDEIFDAWDKVTFRKLKISYTQQKEKKRGTKQYYYANQTENSIKKKIEAMLGKNELSEDNVKKKKETFLFLHYLWKYFFFY
ncbi:MAG: hypothetical protein ABDH49_08420 [Candidatus Hydrothermales bacterium]